MRLTIIPCDGTVIVDGDSKFQPLDLAGCAIPSDVHALQWFENKGWIEFGDSADPFVPKPQNQIIDELPEWANACIQEWTNWTPPPPAPRDESAVVPLSSTSPNNSVEQQLI